jgi:carnitine O-acetyltransferase
MTTAPSAHAATRQAQPDTSSGSAPSSSKGITFANQGSLSKLPIPDLEASCRRYLDSLGPLQSSREHEETKAAVQEFLKSDGPELQEKLKAYASSKTSFIEQFCKSAVEHLLYFRNICLTTSCVPLLCGDEKGTIHI